VWPSDGRFWSEDDPIHIDLGGNLQEVFQEQILEWKVVSGLQNPMVEFNENYLWPQIDEYLMNQLVTLRKP